METRERRGDVFPYDHFMAQEGLPIHKAVVGMDDVTNLPRSEWPRLGGKGAFIQLQGTFEAQRGLQVVEIPGGGALEPIKHLYEEEIFVLKGRGISEVWQGSGAKLTFEWGEGSVFADIYANGGYFQQKDKRTTEGWYSQGIVHTNFIPDARRLTLDALEQKVAGGQLTGYRMGTAFPHGHISQGP